MISLLLVCHGRAAEASLAGASLSPSPRRVRRRAPPPFGAWGTLAFRRGRRPSFSPVLLARALVCEACPTCFSRRLAAAARSSLFSGSSEEGPGVVLAVRIPGSCAKKKVPFAVVATTGWKGVGDERWPMGVAFAPGPTQRHYSGSYCIFEENPRCDFTFIIGLDFIFKECSLLPTDLVYLSIHLSTKDKVSRRPGLSARTRSAGGLCGCPSWR